MTYAPIAAESFGGLNLLDDPGTVGWSGAIDLLNVDFERRGRVRSRDGVAVYVAHGATPNALFSWPGQARIVVADGTNITVYTSAGSQGSTATASTYTSFAPLGTSTTDYGYLGRTSGQIQRIATNGALTSPAGMPSARLVCAQNPDSRLVAAGIASNNHRVQFSNAGLPETWGANDYVDIEPGDGEAIQNIVSWGNLVFAFKQTKAYVFYGNTTDSSGNPVFNYRRLPGDIGINRATVVTSRSAVGTSTGVYFIGRRGIYRTTGDAPQKISGPLDPLFETGASVVALPFFSGLGGKTIDPIGLVAWSRYVAYVCVDTTPNYHYFIYNTETDQWNYWQFGDGTWGAYFCAVLSGERNSPERLLIGQGTNLLYTSPAATDDNGTAITSRYRSGFSDLGTSDPKTIREWKLTGSGSPTFKTSFDFGSLSTGSAITLGTSPAIADGRDRTAVKGQQIGWQVGATSAWSLNALTANIREKKAPGDN